MSAVQFRSAFISQIRRGQTLQRNKDQIKFEVTKNPIISTDESGLKAAFHGKQVNPPPANLVKHNFLGRFLSKLQGSLKTLGDDSTKPTEEKLIAKLILKDKQLHTPDFTPVFDTK